MTSIRFMIVLNTVQFNLGFTIYKIVKANTDLSDVIAYGKTICRDFDNTQNWTPPQPPSQQ